MPYPVFLEEQLEEARGRVSDLERQLQEAQQSAAFFKCCALSGEIPKPGAEPFPAQQESQND